MAWVGWSSAALNREFSGANRRAATPLEPWPGTGKLSAPLVDSLDLSLTHGQVAWALARNGIEQNSIASRFDDDSHFWQIHLKPHPKYLCWDGFGDGELTLVGTPNGEHSRNARR
jgi:hypothetical protein